MKQPLTPTTVLMLLVPPLLWAGNAVVGRMVHDLIPPITFNFLRWLIALFILLPIAGSIYRRGSGLWIHWRHYTILGLLGIGLYNALLYLALESSTPINVTLVAASTPMWVLIVGWMFFDTKVGYKQMVGAVLSVVGVLLVLSRGELSQLLALRLVPGDLFMLAASIAWAFYSWLLSRNVGPEGIRSNWATFLLAQISFGVVWSGLFAAGEWALSSARIQWGWPTIAALLFVAIGPAIVALRCWNLGVQRVGPNTAAFFINLMPLFAALMSAAFLGEMPHLYHALAFALIVGGIILSSRR